MDMNYRGGMWEGVVGRMEWSGGGRKWDNCNSIINKYIKKKNNKVRLGIRASAEVAGPACTGGSGQMLTRKSFILSKNSELRFLYEMS